MQEQTIGPDGSIYIADADNYRVRRVGADGIIRTAIEWREARRPTTMKPSERDMARPTSGGRASESLGSYSSCLIR